MSDKKGFIEMRPNTQSKSNPVQHWGVDVRVNHRQILTIESNCVYGIESFTESEEEAIRLAAENLLSFVGKRKEPKP